MAGCYFPAAGQDVMNGERKKISTNGAVASILNVRYLLNFIAPLNYWHGKAEQVTYNSINCMPYQITIGSGPYQLLTPETQ
jgi:hypothetical protein